MPTGEQVLCRGYLLCEGLMVPIVVDTSRIQPVPDPKMQGSDCCTCQKPQANWLFRPDDLEGKGSLFICSICWLYESQWSKNRRKELDALIAETETQVGHGFLRDKGRLVESKDADRIMAAITYLSRMLEMRARAGGEG